MMDFNPADWNPRYIAYCHANGEADPNDMLTADRVRWPGGVMCGFLLWISREWRLSRIDSVPESGQRAFDAWLDTRYAEVAA